jgi:hypothetical protein
MAMPQRQRWLKHSKDTESPTTPSPRAETLNSGVPVRRGSQLSPCPTSPMEDRAGTSLPQPCPWGQGSRAELLPSFEQIETQGEGRVGDIPSTV